MAFRHYNPNFILRQFAGNDELLWVLDKLTGQIRPEKPSKIRTAKGWTLRYRALGENNYNPDRVEPALSRVESDAAPVIKKIIACARTGKAPAIHGREMERLCAFLLVQIIRSPRMKHYAMNNEWESPEDKELFWEMLLATSNGDWPSGLEAEVANASMRNHPHQDLILWRRMTGMRIDVGTICPEGAARFVIGDEPCLLNGWLVRSGDIVTMPLAKDAYIQLSRPEDSTGGVHTLIATDVEAHNMQSFGKARRFLAGPDPKCLRGLQESVGPAA